LIFKITYLGIFFRNLVIPIEKIIRISKISQRIKIKL